MASYYLRCASRSILSPLLFLVYVNDAPNYITSQSTIALFAEEVDTDVDIDTTKCIVIYKSTLKVFINGVLTGQWILTLNKCQVLRISKKKAKRVSGHCILGGKDLECASHIKDLGVTASQMICPGQNT